MSLWAAFPESARVSFAFTFQGVRLSLSFLPHLPTPLFLGTKRTEVPVDLCSGQCQIFPSFSCTRTLLSSNWVLTRI